MIKKWIKDKLGITQLEDLNRNLSIQNSMLSGEIRNIQNEISKYTKVDADIGLTHRSNNTIILTGQFRNKGFVRFYDVTEKDFEYMVNQMKEMTKYGDVRNIDEPVNFDFRGYFNI